MPRLSRAAAAFALGVGLAALGLRESPTLQAQQKPTPPAVPATFPMLTTPANLGAKPGATIDLVLTGTNLTDATGVWTSFGGTATIPDGQKDAAKLTVKLAVPADAKPGLHFLRVATKAGVSNIRPISLDVFPEVAETGKNRSKSTPQTIPVPCVVTGTATAEAADYFKFPVQAGVPVTVEAIGRRLGSQIDPVLIFSDGTGRELGGVYADDTPGLQSDARVTVMPKTSGELIVEVRDTTYRGGADFAYRLRVGNFPGATTAFPLAVERGKTAPVGFSGPGLDGVKPVSVTAPTDPTVSVVYVAPKRSDGAAGWPVPVLVSDFPELVEQEPNNDPAKANKLPVPGGISARFGEKNDLDHFTFTGKKGTKYVILAETYEVNSPAEVLFRVLDAKGAEVAKSNPQQPAARVEFTPAADGEFVIACEHVNYLAGPSEVYHLTVIPATPDFGVIVGLDRIDVPLGAVGLLPVTGLAKLNGFAGPVELTVVGDGLTGSLSVPAAANPQPTAPVFIPVTVKAGAKPGPVAVVLKATAKIDGKDVVRYGSVAEIAKAAMGGLPVPPAELATQLAIAVTPEAPFTVAVAFDKAEVAQGATIKGKVTLKRGDKFAEEVALAQIAAPANVTLKLKPVAKGADAAEVELTAAANAAVGPGAVIVRGTAKAGGKDVGAFASPTTVTVLAAKKEEPKKKDEPMKK